MQKIPIGISDFKELRENNFFYIDKSLFIKEIIDSSPKILLITRPRRFGKTLNLSTLRYFFEKTAASNVNLFKDLAIFKQGDFYIKQQGSYPVIFLTFKDVKETNWEHSYKKMRELIQREYQRHQAILNANILDKNDVKYYNSILDLAADQTDYENSLKNLTIYLERYYHNRVILLIDEYDTPIQAGYINNHYEDNVNFIRNLLSAALKDNAFVEKGVLTGILRLAKESIFSGLNNLGVYTLLSSEFEDKFGITEIELAQALQAYQLTVDLVDMQNWYNGYRFGNTVIYNPWSILNYMNSKDRKFIPYWINTADNALVEKLLTNNYQNLNTELETLISGKVLSKKIDESIVYADVGVNEDILWSFLLFSGYLKFVREWTMNSDETRMYDLAIPNREVRMMYRSFVERWFVERIDSETQRLMLKSLVKGDIETFEAVFQETVLKIFSYHDFGHESEKVYQAFVIGLLVWLSDTHDIKSNRESGYGRYDVMLIPKDKSNLGIIIEFKKINMRKNETLEQAIAIAKQQIETQKYANELESLGIHKIKKLVIVFDGKRVNVSELL